jgi:hypothetical protein
VAGSATAGGYLNTARGGRTPSKTPSKASLSGSSSTPQKSNSLTPGAGIGVGSSDVGMGGSAAGLLMNRIRKVVAVAPSDSDRMRGLFDAAFTYTDEKITSIINSKLKTKSKAPTIFLPTSHHHSHTRHTRPNTLLSSLLFFSDTKTVGL